MKDDMRALAASILLICGLAWPGAGCGDDEAPCRGPARAPICGEICESACGCMACPVGHIIEVDATMYVCRTADCYQPLDGPRDGGPADAGPADGGPADGGADAGAAGDAGT